MSNSHTKKRKMEDGKEPAWAISASSISHTTINPIRAIVDNLKMPPPRGDKKLISLSIGDPTVFGNLRSSPAAVPAITAALSARVNGYGPAVGLLSARDAIAKRSATEAAPLTAADIVIASGCSGALTLAIQALASPGENILIPKPGFSIYQTISGHSGIVTKHYNLDPAARWQVDLDHLESLIDGKTRAIVVNNPSNPTGSNYSEDHLRAILAVAEAHRLPIIADEIYAGIVFKGETFHPLAGLSTEVPILSCGGIAKQFIVPGWRLGWVEIHDRHGRFGEGIRSGLQRLSQLILGACTLVQAAVPDLFANTPQSYYEEINAALEEQARVVISELSDVHSLNLIPPQGAMYLMIGIDPAQFSDIANETDFAQKLLDEELVFVLPGTCFNAAGFIRIVTCPPPHMMREACERIKKFCARHAVHTNGN